MNIVHLSCVAPPDHGGIGRVADEIVRRLCASGESATLIAPTRKAKDGEADAKYIVRLPSFIRWGNAAALGGDLEKRLKDADVIHLHYPFFGTAEKVAQFALWHRKPLYLTFHMDASAGFPLGFVFDAYRVLAQPAILRSATKIFVASKDYAEHSSMKGFMRAHPDKIIENPFGVSERFSPGADARTDFGIPSDAFVIGFVSVMDSAHHFKGIETLLSAMPDLPKRAHILFVGDGEKRRVYEARVKDAGFADRCHFIGKPSDEDLVRAYRSMDVLITPSIGKAEAFGLVPAEAQACGIPVIASNLPGVRTVAKDGETGLLIPQKDASALAGAIKKLESDSALRSSLSQGALKASDRFDWDRHVKMLIENYQKN